MGRTKRMGTGTAVFGIVLAALAACSSPSRTADADRSPASNRHVFVEDTAECTSYSDEISPSQQSVIDRLMASHAHRLYHFLWHATRNSWASLNANERKIVRSLDPSWGGNAPLCPTPNPSIDAVTSAAGEEFLLMHHGMIAHLEEALVAENLPCIRGWKDLPAKDDALFPVPRGSADDTSKSDAHGARMEAWAKKLHSPLFLRGKSLSYVGVLVEFTLHNNMHMRWAEAPRRGDDFSPMDGSFSAKTLLAPSYRWLGNPYSAHVNPVFWKLHGWVDETVRIWLRANGYASIASNCAGREKCYAWKSAWVGPSMHDLPRTGAPRDGNVAKGPGGDPGLDAVMKKIAGKAGFGNAKFDAMERAPRTKAPAPGSANDGETSAPAPVDPTLDPEYYLSRYGPCSGG